MYSDAVRWVGQGERDEGNAGGSEMEETACCLRRFVQ